MLFCTNRGTMGLPPVGKCIDGFILCDLPYDTVLRLCIYASVLFTGHEIENPGRQAASSGQRHPRQDLCGSHSHGHHGKICVRYSNFPFDLLDAQMCAFAS